MVPRGARVDAEAAFSLYSRRAEKIGCCRNARKAALELKRNRTLALTAIGIIATLVAAVLQAQEVRLRKGDSIRLEVPQREDLGRLLTIDAKGEVSLPIVGTIRVEGLNLEEARGALLRSLQDIYPSIQSITISLQGEDARRVIYVQGEVALPGKYELGGTPSVWDAIKEAGGATGAASLDGVRIVRSSDEGSTTTIVNLQQALDSGNLDALPVLKPGDAVIVPERTASYSGTGAVNVFGAVVNPASYALPQGRALIDAILAAGGPAEDARLSKVTVIRPVAGGGVMTISVDLKRYLEKGDVQHNPPIFPNDTVNIPRNNSFWTTIANPNFFLAVIAASATVAALLVNQQ
jgi:polysaccharide export outer membrane protein